MANEEAPNNPGSLDELINGLSPEQQEALRRKLNFKVWSRRFEELHSAIEGNSDPRAEKLLGRKFAALVQQLVDDLESPDASNLLLHSMIRNTWQHMLQSVKSQPDPAEQVVPEDPETVESLLTQTYQNLYDQLNEVRKAVAQAIAAEKQIEQQHQKNKDQADTWHNRARMAKQQGNEDLEQQALARKQQYHDAAESLLEQLKEQKESTNKLRWNLTQLEGEVQKAYTQKQILLARDRAVNATLAANEILASVDLSTQGKLLEQVERILDEKEQHLVTESQSKPVKNAQDINELIARAIKSIDTLSAQVSKIDILIREKETKAKTKNPE